LLVAAGRGWAWREDAAEGKPLLLCPPAKVAG
jgi:hypothetical protein